jgi:hypothetical protein
MYSTRKTGLKRIMNDRHGSTEKGREEKRREMEVITPLIVYF